jgi:hypothetical protein
MIRKTLSVGTFGVVSFRGKKERLRRAERSQREAETSLHDEHAARVVAEAESATAHKQVKGAVAHSVSAGRRLERSKRRNRRRRKGETARSVVAGVEPIVRSGLQNARTASVDTAARSRRASRRAGKAATRSLRRAKEAAAPHVASVAARVGEAIEHATAEDS